MLKVIILILAQTLVFVSASSTQTNDSNSRTNTNESSHIKCMYGETKSLSEYLKKNSTCHGCVICQHYDREPRFWPRSSSSYILCKKECSTKEFNTSILVQAVFNFQMLSDLPIVETNWTKKMSPRPGKNVSKDGVTPMTIPNDHVTQPVFIAITLTLFAVCLASSCFLVYICMRKKKQETAFDAIVVHRRQNNGEDENYIRYTKDPTSNTRKNRLRASWPRAARPENRYLLENGHREMNNDQNMGGDSSVTSGARDDNPDSSSAQYVFIQTFPASGATASMTSGANSDQAEVAAV